MERFLLSQFLLTSIQTLQKISKTAGHLLALPANDGIIWKHSSQYSGLMSIYLQGVCPSLPFYLSKHIWYPVTSTSDRNVCFPEGACSLFVCILIVWLCFGNCSCSPDLGMSCRDIVLHSIHIDMGCMFPVKNVIAV